jgi:hypothetical protein
MNMTKSASGGGNADVVAEKKKRLPTGLLFQTDGERGALPRQRSLPLRHLSRRGIGTGTVMGIGDGMRLGVP